MKTLLTLLVAGTLAAGQVRAQSDGGSAPNLVLIVADDLGIGDVSCYGGSIPTPNIDALAAAGVRFSNAYVTAPTCGPSRAGLLSGRNQSSFGFEFNVGKSNLAAHRERGLPQDVPILPERLRAAGHATDMIGKWHLGAGPEAHPLARGFESFFGFLDGAHPYLPGTRRGANGPLMRGRDAVRFEGYLTDVFAREAVGAIESRGERPYFLYAAFNAPHRPFEASEEYLARFPELEGERRVYAAMVSALDDAVGEIVAAIERSGQAQRTLVAFLSDNGAVAGEMGGSNLDLSLGKFFLFEGGVRVPLIVHDPRRAARGRVVDARVSALDVVPTLLAAAGVELPAGLEGSDLAPWLDGQGPERELRLAWRAGVSSALLDGDLKLIQSAESSWLYRLGDDPGEARDLSAELEEELARMSAGLEAARSAFPAPLWRPKRLEDSPTVAGKPYLADY